MSEKTKGLLINILIYIVSFGIGLIPFILITNYLLSSLIFTLVATFVIFIVTCFIPDTSIYDPYWSVAPIVILLASSIKYHTWTYNLLGVGAICVFWSIRLTLNWYITYKGLCHEDWRYHNYRENLSKTQFFLVNLVGLQYVPTLVVFAALIPALIIVRSNEFNPLIVIGLVISVFGVMLEIIADKTVHKFLQLKKNDTVKSTCNIGIWKYSRHPNYLGEIMFWFGLFVAFLLTNIDIWYYGIGFIFMPCLFLFISIPLMEKHNISRRNDYVEYKKKTSMLLLLPQKKIKEK